eukprot:7904904-Karenia_brevis.AAC.1
MRLEEQEQLKFVDLRIKSNTTRPRIRKDLRDKDKPEVAESKSSSSTQMRKQDDSDENIYEPTSAEDDEIDDLMGALISGDSRKQEILDDFPI